MGIPGLPLRAPVLASSCHAPATLAMSRLRGWIESRRAAWKELEQAQARLHAGSLAIGEADRIAEGFRSLAADVTTVRSLLPGSKLGRELEALYARLHLSLLREHRGLRERLRTLYRDEVPAATRRLLPQIFAVGSLFVLFGIAGAVLVLVFPELASLVASEEMIEGVQQGELWTDQITGIVPPSVMSFGIALNNILVALFAFVLGAFYGLGTLYIIGTNGLSIGGIFAFVHQHDLLGRLATFCTAHGFCELSIIVVSGAAGARVGQALARPGHLGRTQAFRLAVADSGRVFAVLAPALVICGLVEGYVSPDRYYPFPARLALGIGLAFVLWTTLLGYTRLFSRSSK
jgi:uncharacterized membrane protein SpoIIM required for sporulation